MDTNKIYDDFRESGISLIVSELNIHSTIITGTTGNRFDFKVFISISEHTTSNDCTNFDIALKINKNIEIEQYFIDEPLFDKYYSQSINLIKYHIKQSSQNK
jgi:hypothetical protein